MMNVFHSNLVSACSRYRNNHRKNNSGNYTCTYLNFDISSPIKQGDELQEKFPSCVSSWPDLQAYIHIYYPVALQA